MKKPSGVRSDESVHSPIDVAKVEQLARIASKYDLSEIELEVGEVRMRLARGRAPAAPAIEPIAASEPPVAKELQRVEATASTADDAVRSPMVGTVYLRPSPEAKPFIEIGSTVKTGDKLLLVEAMKTFNDIVAPRGGRIASILVSDGTPVEYGQPLVIIE
jgi:acetyl-CoA carboxylase biotin carboxyl carrier protein